MDGWMDGKWWVLCEDRDETHHYLLHCYIYFFDYRLESSPPPAGQINTFSSINKSTIFDFCILHVELHHNSMAVSLLAERFVCIALLERTARDGCWGESRQGEIDYRRAGVPDTGVCGTGRCCRAGGHYPVRALHQANE